MEHKYYKQYWAVETTCQSSCHVQVAPKFRRRLPSFSRELQAATVISSQQSLTAASAPQPAGHLLLSIEPESGLRCEAAAGAV